MKTFIAYFDILGFKEFIGGNDKGYVEHHLGHLYRESQHAICGGNVIQGPSGTLLPNFDFAEVNCLHISDSILFWTDSLQETEFLKLVTVCQKFLITSIQASFPMRGCIVAGDIEYNPYQINNKNGKHFNNSILYGQGLVDAYEKAESQDWAGCYIDKSVFKEYVVDENGSPTSQRLIKEQTVYDLMYADKLAFFSVPFKNGTESYEHIIRIKPGPINDVAFRNFAVAIESTFRRHMNGKDLNPSVQRKLFNTIKFLESFKVSEIFTEDLKPKQ